MSLLLLPALVPKSVSGHSRTGPNAGAALDLRTAEPVLLPYLAVVGPPPLRFAAAPPPPDLTVRPPAGAPPVPASTNADSTSTSAPVANVDSKSSPALAATTAPTDSSPATADHSAPAPTKAPPPAILPDDARPAIRPEDFLPYFQIPGQPGGVNLLVPVSTRGAPGPAQLPPSTATYTQSK